ncbi:DciA family protein [Streptomyces sp. HC307]|uniref:DciA family protein n=1 Tax=Streptomyces flavusporus TaxID=3385496 RepID=UPI0039175C45
MGSAVRLAPTAAVGYDADSGRLTLCPESTAWATKLRLEQARVIDAANRSAGKTVVRALRKPLIFCRTAAGSAVSPRQVTWTSEGGR